MIENLVDFGLNVVAGAAALLLLFEGTRRLVAYGAHRKAALIFFFSFSACIVYGALAYQKYADLKSRALLSQPKTGAKPAVANWRQATNPEKREQLSMTLARQTFKESGALGPFVDRNGETRTFAPNQQDLLDRERVVTYQSRAESAARASLAEALLWLIAGLVAIVLGVVMSLDRPPAKSQPDEAAQNS